MSSGTRTDTRTKTIELEVEVDATPEQVWQALSEGEHLKRWFPLDARVEPGVGGSMWLSWGKGCEGSAAIEIWEENHHLRAVEEYPGDPEPRRVLVDYVIESHGGVTKLRLVNSGFSADDDWAEYIDTLDSGWRYFLWNLKHYLERHPGKSRTMVWHRRKVSGEKSAVWDRLFGEDGLVACGGGKVEGGPARLWSGDMGEVHMLTLPIHMAARFETLGDALLLIELEPGTGEYSLGVWLSLYGASGDRAHELQGSLDRSLERLFG